MPKHVLVTGASRGIGRAIAERLADLDWRVIAWARTGHDLADLAAGRSNTIRTAMVDVTDWDSIRAGIASSLDDVPSLDAVVVNAGIGQWGAVGELPPAAWSAMVGTNLSGAFFSLSQVLPFLLRGSGAQVVALVSDSAEFPYPGRSAYCASKAGLKSLVESFRREVRAHNVRVTGIYPSRVDTYFRDRQPGSRPGVLSTQDVAHVVEFVLSLPPHVELRQISLSSIHSEYGPFPERAPVPVEASEAEAEGQR